jgi:predicted nucleic acid-binding protein
MAERFLIDTSAIIKYLNGIFPAPGNSFLDKVLNEESSISFITEIELQVWNPSNPEDIKIYHSFVEQSNILGIDQDIIRETIKIRKSKKVKLPDALIAATAIIHDRTLVADNDKDFKRVPKLKYINPNRLVKK